MSIDPKKRYKENPFIEQQVITAGRKRVLIGRGNNVLLDMETGEMAATNVATYREVDDAQFVKLFTQNIGLTFNLTASGVKALGALMWAMQQGIGKDVVTMDKYTHQAFIEAHQDHKMAYPTFAKGLNELVRAQIIARAQRMGDYYINPHFAFNGDRVRFITEIRRKSAAEKHREALEAAGQQRLFWEGEA